MSGEHRYRSAPASPEYRDNWERIFGSGRKREEFRRLYGQDPVPCKTMGEIAAEVYNRHFGT